MLNIAGSWDRPEDDRANVDWARAAWSDMKSFSTGGTYLNFLTEEEGSDRIEAAYGRPALDKLAALKRKYDPGNFFRHTKSVGG